MKHAIGLVEAKNITKGILMADAMLKAANVELVTAQPVCPGKYIVMVAGDVGAVESSVKSGRAAGGDSVVDEFLLSNVHPGVFPALTGCVDVKELKALGVIESYSAASAIIAADAAAKAAAVELIEIRLARGLGGKAVVWLTGDIGAVNAAVAAGSGMIIDSGFLIDTLILAAPHKNLHTAML